MKDIDVFEQYFEADCVYNGIARHAAAVKLNMTSEEGNITYKVCVIFFPHNDETDYLVTYDAYGEKILYEAKGRRSRKKDEQYLAVMPETAQKIAADMGGKIFFDKPLIEARRG